MNFNNAAIIGAGAIGSFYGAKLKRSGLNVQFQTRAGSAALRKELMKIQSVWGDFTVMADAHESAETMDPADLIIVTTKAIENIDYFRLLNPVIKKNSVILLIQNGLNTDEKVQQLFPEQTVIGGAAFVCLNRISPTDIRHLAYGRIDIGYLKAENISLAEDVVSLFKTAGIDVNLSGPIREIRWKKLLWNVPFNVLSVLLFKANTKEMIEDNNILKISIGLMKEVKKIANAEGVNITDIDIDKMIENTRVMVPYKTSMLLDFEEHRPMEVEAILGEPLNAAEKLGINTPYLKLLYAQLKFADTHKKFMLFK